MKIHIDDLCKSKLGESDWIYGLFSVFCTRDICLRYGLGVSCQGQGNILFFFSFLPAPNTVPRAPLSISRGMEQLQGAGRGTESPGLQDGISPQERDERGESLLSLRPLLSKSSRLEVNGSPAAPGNRQYGTPLRPLGGGGHICFETEKGFKHLTEIQLSVSHYLLMKTFYLSGCVCNLT